MKFRHVAAAAVVAVVGVIAAGCTIPVQVPPPAPNGPAPSTGGPREPVAEPTTISEGGSPGAPLVIEGKDFLAGLRIVANDVVVRNSSVVRPGGTDPALYILGDRVVIEDVSVAGPDGGAEGIRLEGGDGVVLRRVVVPGLQFVDPTSHSDALQVYLQRPLTNVLIEDSTFNGTVAGDPEQDTANGSQIDGARGAISGTIRNTTFEGGRYFSSRYYNVSGPLTLEGVRYVKPMTTNSPEGLVVQP